LPSDRPMVSAQVLHQATSPTSLYATWAHRFFAELYGFGFFAELYGSDGVGVSVSRPSNDPCHANRCAPNQNADALRSWSCRTLKRLMVWSPPTTQQSPRRAWGRSVLDKYRRCSGLNRKVSVPSLKGQVQKPKIASYARRDQHLSASLSFVCVSGPKLSRCYAPPMHTIKLTKDREITPFVLVHPGEER